MIMFPLLSAPSFSLFPPAFEAGLLGAEGSLAAARLFWRRLRRFIMVFSVTLVLLSIVEGREYRLLVVLCLELRLCRDDADAKASDA